MNINVVQPTFNALSISTSSASCLTPCRPKQSSGALSNCGAATCSGPGSARHSDHKSCIMQLHHELYPASPYITRVPHNLFD